MKNNPFKPEYRAAADYADKHEGHFFSHALKAEQHEAIKKAFLAGCEYQKQIEKNNLNTE
jgi:hypothetical protein